MKTMRKVIFLSYFLIVLLSFACVYPALADVAISYQVIGDTKATAHADITLTWEAGITARVYESNIIIVVMEEGVGASNDSAPDPVLLYEGLSPFVHSGQNLDQNYSYIVEFLDAEGNVTSTEYCHIYTAWLKPPENFVVTRNPDDASVTLTWDQVAEPYAQGYRISSNVGEVIINEVTVTSYTDTPAPKATAAYSISSFDGEDPRNYGQAAVGFCYYLTMVENVTATRTADGAAVLSWDQAPEAYAAGYHIMRSIYNEYQFTSLIDISEVTTTSFVDSTAEKGISYHYTIGSRDGDDPPNYGRFAQTAAYWLSPPANCQATAGDSMVSVTWDQASEPWAAGYHVYQVIGGQPTTLLAEISDVMTTTFTQTDLENGVTYTYAVCTFDTEDPYNLSGYIFVSAKPGTDPTGPPQAPTWWKVIAGDGCVRLLWEKNLERDLNRYVIYRSDTVGGTPVAIGNTILLDYRDANVTNNTTYYYYLTATDTEGLESELSAVREVTPYAVIDQTDPQRVLVVYRDDSTADANKNGVIDTDEIRTYYLEKRGISATNTLAITGIPNTSASWADKYDAVFGPIREKLDQLGPDTIYHIVLIDFPLSMGSGLSTQTLAMNAYNLERETSPISRSSNPLYRYRAQTFRDPAPHFNHAMYTGPQHGVARHAFYYLAAQLNDLTALSQIEGSLYGERYGGHENYLGGYHMLDSRYGTHASVGDIHDTSNPQSPWNLDNYPSTSPYQGGYSYAAMDMKMVTCVRYCDEAGIANYRWHSSGNVIGAAPGEHFEDGTPVRNTMPALSYAGWYNWTYRNVYRWLPGSFYEQVISGSPPAEGARSHGCTFVSAARGEPYTNGVVQPAEYHYYALDGYTYGEAVAYSLPLLNWQNWSSGDPLTCVYKKGKTAQLDIMPPPAPQSYVVNISPGTTEVHASLDTAGREPDLAHWKLAYGTEPGTYTVTIDYDPTGGYWRYKKFTLTGLEPNTTYYYQITVRDPVGNETVAGEEMFTTSAGNRQPLFDYTFAVTAFQGQSIQFLIPSATDPDGELVTYEVNGTLPGGATFDSATRRFSWDIPLDAITPYNLTFTASDATQGVNVRIPLYVFERIENRWVSTGDTDGANPVNWSTGAAPQSGETLIFDPADSTVACVLPAGTYGQILMRDGYTGTLTFSGNTIVTNLKAAAGTLAASSAMRLEVRALIDIGASCTIDQTFAQNVDLKLGYYAGYAFLTYGTIRAKTINFAVGNRLYKKGCLYIHPDCILDPDLSFTRELFTNSHNLTLIVVRSMEDGQQYTLGDEAESSLMRYLDIKDASAQSPGLTVKYSEDKGNNSNITFASSGRPNIDSKTPPDEGVFLEQGQQELFSAQLSDPENDLLHVAWILDGAEVTTEDIQPGETTYTYEAPLVAGRHQVRLEVLDPDGNYATTVWNIEIGGPQNNPPTLNPIGNLTGPEGEWLCPPRITADDVDGDTLTITADNLPSGVRFFEAVSSAGHVEYILRWPAKFVKAGTYANVTFTVSDGNGGTATETITITIDPHATNRPPTLPPIGTFSGNEGEWFAIPRIIATDPDDDDLTITITDFLPGMRFFKTDSRAGYVEYKLRWPDKWVRQGTHIVTFTVSDGKGGTDTKQGTIIINDTGNQQPVLVPAGTFQGHEGVWFSIPKIVATDNDGDTLTITAEGLQSGMRLFPTESRDGYVVYKLRWVDRFVTAGTYTINFTVSDGSGGTDTKQATITITP
jgi:fibronectin type 3 domain-containing protein